MNTQFFSMAQLLKQAGFALHGATRADCIYCQGQSRGTVAFTSEVAFCHRCKWTANIVRLARESGLLRGNSRAAKAIRDSARRRAQIDSELQSFEVWRDNQISSVSDRYRSLWRKAGLAAQVLLRFPDCEAAWCALADFYHSEARLSGLFDFFTFTKASVWLEADSTPVEVFETWRRYAA
jgi:hypothetical protein